MRPPAGVFKSFLLRERPSDRRIVQEKKGREQRLLAFLARIDKLWDRENFNRIIARKRECAVGGSEIDSNNGGGQND